MQIKYILINIMKRSACQAYGEDRAFLSVTTLTKLTNFYGFYSLGLFLGMGVIRSQETLSFQKH